MVNLDELRELVDDRNMGYEEWETAIRAALPALLAELQAARDLRCNATMYFDAVDACYAESAVCEDADLIHVKLSAGAKLRQALAAYDKAVRDA